MLKIITNKSDYKFSPELATDTVSYDLPLTLFGKPVRPRTLCRLWHVCRSVPVLRTLHGCRRRRQNCHAGNCCKV